MKRIGEGEGEGEGEKLPGLVLLIVLHTAQPGLWSEWSGLSPC